MKYTLTRNSLLINSEEDSLLKPWASCRYEEAVIYTTEGNSTFHFRVPLGNELVSDAIYQQLEKMVDLANAAAGQQSEVEAAARKFMESYGINSNSALTKRLDIIPARPCPDCGREVQDKFVGDKSRCEKCYITIRNICNEMDKCFATAGSGVEIEPIVDWKVPYDDKQSATCPQNHHLKDGPCMDDYCSCQCERCREQCRNAGR